MLELIIDNMGPFEGITKQYLFTEMDSLLTLMDRAKQAHSVSKQDHIKVLDFILEKLVRHKNKKGIRLEFTDYSEIPPIKRELAFRLINFRTYDNEKVVLFAEPEAVNFFIQMLDVDLEDHLDWFNDIPKELRKAMEHINDCIREQDLQNRKINLQLKDLGEEYFKRGILIELKDLLEKSRDKLLPLQNKINEARLTFLEEQWLQELTLKKTNKLSIETDILDVLIKKKYNQVEKSLREFYSFFAKIGLPKLLTYNQLIMLLLKKSKARYDSSSEVQFPKKQISITDLIYYPDSLKAEAIDFLRQNLSIFKRITLDELIRNAINESKSLLLCNYLKMLILGKFAYEPFEKRVIPESIRVVLKEGELTNELFEGNNFEISFYN